MLKNILPLLLLLFSGCPFTSCVKDMNEIRKCGTPIKEGEEEPKETDICVVPK